MAGNRCDSCGKMVALDLEDPEVEDEKVNNNTNVTGTVNLKRNCAECGGEMKQATLDIDVEVPDACPVGGEGHEEKTVEVELSKLEEGGGRYKKSYYGAEGTVKITCSCGKSAEAPWSDKIAASDFEDV